MSYIVNWASTGLPGGKPAITILERTFDSDSTSLTLTGKGLNNYGLFQQENFLKLLENFANTLPPSHPTSGQLFWNTAEQCMKVWTGVEWKNVCTDHAYRLGDYNLDPDPNTEGFANRINRIVGASFGAPSGEDYSGVWGWGQTDRVPLYNNAGTLTSQANTWIVDLPGGNIFPPRFDNNAWAIAISRLRKALRQVGLNETVTSPIGFIDDGLPNGLGNSLANLYNDYGAGGTMANIIAGFSAMTTPEIQSAFNDTVAALDDLETYRFSLGLGQFVITNAGTATRNSASKSLTIPTPPGTYTHRVRVKFGSEEAAKSFFNTGGQVQFELDFAPVAMPSDVENDWNSFLNVFTGLTFDFKGFKRSAAYLTPSFTPQYLPVTGNVPLTYTGFYDLTDTSQPVFIRDVLSTLANSYAYSTPLLNGGLVISAFKQQNGPVFEVVFDIDFQLRHVVQGSPAQQDTTDTSLTGELRSEVIIYRADTENVNSPILAVPIVSVNEGTFITAL